MEQAAALIPVSEVQQERAVTHRTGQHMVHRNAVHGFGKGGPPGRASATGLETEQAAAGRRDADTATPVIGARYRHHPGCHHGGRATGRTTGGMIRIPGVAGRTIGIRLGDTLGAELRGIGAPEGHQTSGLPAGHQGGILVGANVVFLARLVALIAGRASHFLEQVLHQHGHPGQRTRQRCCRPFPGLLIERNDQRIQGGVDLLRPGDGCLQQLAGSDLALTHQLRQPHGIKLAIFLELHACALPKTLSFLRQSQGDNPVTVA